MIGAVMIAKSPVLWALGLACLAGGAAAGHAVGSAELRRPSTLGIVEDASRIGTSRIQARAPMPDHYPLVTRAGTIPVAALATRGLYSQARYQHQHVATEPPALAALASDTGPAPGAGLALVEDPAAGPPAADVTIERGGSRFVDVKAVLAMQ